MTISSIPLTDEQREARRKAVSGVYKLMIGDRVGFESYLETIESILSKGIDPSDLHELLSAFYLAGYERKDEEV